MKKTSFSILIALSVLLVSFFLSYGESADKVSVINPLDSIVYQKSALNFIAFGDWGRSGEYNQKQVAQQMGKTAKNVKAEFIVSTGDNIYPSGVISEFDPGFKRSFEDIYTDFSLQVDWYLVLGNHDYKADPNAEVAYSKISRRWKMPARYYSKKFSIKGDTAQKVLMVFTDMNTLIPSYYTSSEYGEQVRTQDSVLQKKWIEKTLSDPDKNIRWRIVVGHQPIYSGSGRKDSKETLALRGSLRPLLEKYNVDVYLTGHEHNLQHIVPQGKTQYFISGAGSETTPVELLPESRFAASVPGFMVFSILKDQLLVQIVDADGKLIYHTSIKK